jgi:hypothetical protein
MIPSFVLEAMACESKVTYHYYCVEVRIGLISWNLNILNMLIVDGKHYRCPSHGHFSIELHSMCVSSEYHD